MKISMIIPYINIPGLNVSDIETGFGVMVHSIAEALATNNNQVYVLGYYCNTKELQTHGYTLEKNDLKAYRRKAFLHPFQSLKAFFNSGQNSKKESIYFQMLYMNILQHLRSRKPDIVSIQSMDLAGLLTIKACELVKIPYVVSVHGFDNIEKGVVVISEQEKRFIQEVNHKNCFMIANSFGVKQLLLQQLENRDANVFCISNFLSSAFENKSFNQQQKDVFRSERGLTEKDKMFVTVGSLCDRKNQKQAIRALALRKEQTKKNDWWLFVIGPDLLNGELCKLSSELCVNDRVVFTGLIDMQSIGDYYNACDYVIMTSITEGFGLSLIEGMVFGKPSIAFSDFNAIENIYNEKAMVLIDARSDEAVVAAMDAATQKQFSIDEISAYAKKFCRQNIIQDYIKVFERAIKVFKEKV